MASHRIIIAGRDRRGRTIRALRAALASGAALAALAAPSLAQAASPADVEALEARVEQLEAMLSALREEVEAARAAAEGAEAAAAADASAAADAVIRLEARSDALEARVAAAETDPRSPPPAGAFQAGDTVVTYGGYVDLDAHVTDLTDGEFASASVARDFYIPGATPVGGEGPDAITTDFTAQATRFFFATETPSDLGPVKTKIEFDFLLSPGGDERVSNSFNPRMRLAYVDVGPWRFGQDWTTFQNLAAIPESASFLIASDGMIFGRQAMVRYTRGPFQFALENPDTTVTPFGGGARIETDDGAIPDVVARYNHVTEHANIAFAAIARQLAYEHAALDIDDETTAWGVSAQGRVRLRAGTDVRFSLAGGEGMGRYIGLNAVNGAVLDANGDLQAIPSWGGLVALRQEIGGGRRVNLGYSHLEADNDVALTGLSATRSVYSGFANLMTEIGPGVVLGGELMFGERELENGETGSITRFTLSTKYAF